MAYRKRKGNFPSWGAKKRRTGNRRKTFKRKRRGGGARSASWTIQTSTGQGLRPVARKLNRRAFKRLLWRETITDIHWKSGGTTATTFGVTSGTGLGDTVIVRPTFVGAPGPTTAFWTAAGGLVPKDTGSTAPTFAEGNLTIRGGQIGVLVTQDDTTVTETSVRIWVVRLVTRPDDTVVPATIGYGTQLTTVGDFEYKFGKVIDYKEATINNAYPIFTYVRRLGVQKIDMEDWGTSLGSQIAFVIALTNLQTGDDLSLPAVVWHDLSFCGDTVT